MTASGFLLTRLGTLVCRDGDSGAIVHARLLDVGERLAPVRFAAVGNGAFSALDADAVAYPDRGGAASTPYGLRLAGRTVRAAAGGTLLPSAGAATDAFQVLDGPQFDALRMLVRSDWVEVATKTIIRSAQIDLLPDFRLRVGDEHFDLSEPFPITPSRGGESKDAIHLFADQWKLRRLIRYDPLIYFVAVGPRYHKMLAIAIRSLETTQPAPPRYLVFTDVSREALVETVGLADPERLQVAPFTSTSPFEISLQRFRAHEVLSPLRSQPVIYADVDVLFTRDISSLLARLVCSRDLEVGLEFWSPLRERVPVGAALVNADPAPLDEYLGFNSGLIGIPNVDAHAETLHAIVDVALRYTASIGAEGLGQWYDQPVANYVATRVGGVSGGLLTPAVEHIRSDFYDLSWKRSIAHCWGVSDKLDWMERRLASLKGRARAGLASGR